MTTGTSIASRDAEAAEGPSSSVEPRASRCPGCGLGVDPLRAGHVAILEGRFFYFCQADCKRAYLEVHGRALEENVETARPPAVGSELPGDPAQTGSAPDPLAAAPRTHGVGPSTSEARVVLPSPRPSPSAVRSPAANPGARVDRRGRALQALEATGIACGLLVPAIGLLGSGATLAHIPLTVTSLAALLLRFALLARDRSDPHPLVVLVPTIGAVGSACYAQAVHDPHAEALVVFAALSCAVAIAVDALVARARVRVAAARDGIERALDVSVRVVRGEDTIERPVSEIRPGEQVVVEAGEIVGVDATVTAGEARVVPWLGAQVELPRREGDCILAGARVITSRLRMTTTWSGRERAWVKLLSSPATRIDVAAPTARSLRHTVERGAPLAALVLGVAAIAANSTPVEVVAAMCAGAIGFAARTCASIVALHFARAHLEALARGIVYKDARAFERAAAANVAVLSARGTVLMGEPEIVAIEPVGAFEVERVLALAAGAEKVSVHPFAAAVLRATRMRGVRPDPVRNGAVSAGLGVTAVASTGERLVVGGRAIMLKQKIGVAATDARVSELEAQGRSVLLVALGDRLVGIIALQDGLRPGGRAAVQRLLDARIEPVLLSGEARDTCATIGLALDIEHVRPEVLPGDRGAEVRALAEGGSVVAVIGHPANDDAALGAADVAVAMGAAGSTPGEWAVVLASDDVRDAARALAIPHTARDRARFAMVLGAAPSIIALLAIGFGVAPLAIAPIAVLVGAVAVAAHARESTTAESLFR